MKVVPEPEQLTPWLKEVGTVSLVLWELLLVVRLELWWEVALDPELWLAEPLLRVPTFAHTLPQNTLDDLP